MSMLLAHRGHSPGLYGFSPMQWGSDLYAGWDGLLRPDLIAASGGAVSSWKDMVGAYDAIQDTGASKPTVSGAWVYGDGVDDELTLAPVPAGIPIGATACEEWFLVDQQSLAADATTRVLGGWGGATTTVSRRLSRSVVSSVNRGSVIDSGTTLANGSVDFSGRKVVRLIATGTQVDIEIDGVSAGLTSQVSALGNARLRFFAHTAASAGAFALAGISARYICAPRSAAQAAQMLAYLNSRK